MCLDNHGVSRGQCGRGVASSNGECKRKVTGSEYDDRPKWTQHRTNVGFRKRLAFGISPVHARVYPRSVFCNLRE